MSVKERLKTFIEYKNISIAAFCRSIGVSVSYVSSMNKSIQPDKIESITICYPDLNTGWLLTGVGDMLLPDLNNARVKEINNFMNIPLVTVRAKAGYLTGYGDMEYIESLPTVPVIVDRTYKGKYLTFEVDGDSMDDGTRQAICDRDVVLGRDIKKELWKSKLHIKDWNFIIVHKYGITVKRITDHNTETGIIKCHSVNPIYEDFELSLDETYELYNLIKIVDRNVKL